MEIKEYDNLYTCVSWRPGKWECFHGDESPKTKGYQTRLMGLPLYVPRIFTNLWFSFVLSDVLPWVSLRD